MQPALRVVAILAGIWIVAGGVVWLARLAKPTPASLERYVAAHPLAGAAPSERGRVIEKVADQLNRLSYEDRRSFREKRELDGFFHALTPEERSRFLDLTLPEGFHQMMTALNEMKPEQRRKIVQRALADLEAGRGPGDRDGGNSDRPPLDAAQQEKIIQLGMSAFYEDANADVKLDFAPVIEQMQRSLQHLE
jgi:hypothetical protein